MIGETNGDGCSLYDNGEEQRKKRGGGGGRVDSYLPRAMLSVMHAILDGLPVGVIASHHFCQGQSQ